MTAPCIDVRIDVDLERSPVCEVMHGTLEAPQVTWRECNRVALWVAVISCCGGFSLLVCRPHHDSPAPWACRKCNADIPDSSVRWVRL
jgi:hypothetical protein